ncbi:elongation factor 1-gamma-A-like [Paramacrobiotus metropolitanus]|uniref:elongation factor 1-gamma-A-like n=1 Tax=Paramacrobiotus metropolitanus TaxID=2943436 RepID=UPI00244594AD|nr:elongation factor 1-gamma-A-like [Paramacrobiotus metropolitanus]
MSVSGTLFTYPDNFRAYKALIAAQFSGAKVKVVSEIPDFVFGETNKTPEFLKKFPSGQVPAFESADEKVHLSEGNAIAHFLATPELRGSSAEKQALMLQWVNFSDQYIVPSVVALVLKALGNPVADSQDKSALDELNNALKVLNTHLGEHKYVTGDQLSLADITVFADLYFAFTHVLDEKTRQQNQKVTQWFQGLAEQPQFKAVVGAVALFSGQKKGGEGDKGAKKDKKDKPAKEEKPKEEKKPKKKEDDEEMDLADEASAEPPQKDPFLALPGGSFNMDEFKRTYSNEDTKTVALPYFWSKFDKENYSIWYCEYKYPQELMQVFMSCNLITGMFQRLDKMRKHSFGSMVLFGENNNSTISGVWFWRGQGLAFELSPDWQVDYESYEWKKLDPDAQETKKMVDEYFAWEGDFGGKKFNQGKIFK